MDINNRSHASILLAISREYGKNITMLEEKDRTLLEFSNNPDEALVEALAIDS